MIAEFYRGRLQQDNWQLEEDRVEGEEIRLQASREGQDWPLTVVIRPRTAAENGTNQAQTDSPQGTEFELTYVATPIESDPAPPEESEAAAPQPSPAVPGAPHLRRGDRPKPPLLVI